MDADVFIIFERIMSMGIKELYGTIDDITSIKGRLENLVSLSFHLHSNEKYKENEYN